MRSFRCMDDCMDGRALVLGGGGVTGIAWETGLIAGLAGLGIDLAAADVIIGTSAGSVVGTDIACGQEPEALYQAQLAPSAPEPAARIGWDFGIPRLPSAGLRRHVLAAADDSHQAAGPFTRFCFDQNSASIGATVTRSFTASASCRSSVIKASASSWVRATYSASNVSGQPSWSATSHAAS